MKKVAIFLLALAIFMPVFTFAQIYQLPNPGFENWDGTQSDAEPSSWNSFATAECTLTFGCSMAKATHHERSTDVRPGSTGTYSCRIWASSILGVVANGNMTTGRIHAGSMTAASSSNYNVSYPSQSSYAQAFNGKPDYMKFWAKVRTANSSTQARMNTIIHNNSEVRDPVIASDNNNIVGVATLNYSGNNTWQEYTVPFDYDSYGCTTPEYVLITFSTNKTPGSGSENDEVYIDDIEFVYISTLSDLKSNGTTVPNFSASTLQYSIELPYGTEMPTITATATSANAVVNITQPTEANPTATIVVTQGPSTTTYVINYTFSARESADLVDILLDESSISNYDVTPAFNANVTTYNVRLPYGSDYPVVDAILEEPTAQMNITQPTEAVPTATIAVTSGSLAKTYTVNFTIAPGLTADLEDLMLDGITITNFDPEVTEYAVMLPYGADYPVISAVAADENATLDITQPTAQTPTGTVVVTNDSITKTYTVEFSMASLVSAQLSSLMVNEVLIPGFSPATYEYTYELPYATDMSTVTVSATTISSTATISPIIVDTVTTIEVADADSMATYTITFTFAAEQTADLADLRLNDTTIANFSPAVTSYTVVLFSNEFPEVSATPRSTAATLAITQATEENPIAIVTVTCGGLSKNYIVNFTIEEANADLADLQVNGSTIAGFDPQTTEYELELAEGSSLPNIAATAASSYATMVITQPTTENPVATIVVTCGELTKTYTVTITFIDAVADYQTNSFQVYPNPVDDVLNVVCTENVEGAEMVVYNTMGQIVVRQTVSSDFNSLNVSSLKPGLYILQIRTEGALLGTQKFVKR